MKLSVLLGAVLALAACNKVTYVSPTTMPTGQVSEETGHYFIFGLAGSKEIHAERLCPEGVSKVQSRFTFGDLILGALTVGLYTPRTYEISCGKAAQ